MSAQLQPARIDPAAPRASTPLCSRIRSRRKVGGHGVHRTVIAGETWRRLQPSLRKIGITRVADITGLDHIGIPVYSCVRPSATSAGVSVTCGKGITPVDARVGSIMEALEYYCAEAMPRESRNASFEEISRHESVLNPADLILPSWSPYRPDRPIDWVVGWNLADGEPWWIPANAVLHSDLGSASNLMVLRGSTNGLASGNELEEAICHALAEVIERDAWSMAWVRVNYGCGDRIPGVDLSRVAGPAAWMNERFASRGVEVLVRDITSEFGVPCFYAGTLERVSGHVLAHEGMGAHPDSAVALARALSEAAQSRAADIQGSREDLDYWRRRAGEWNEAVPSWGPSKAKSISPFDQDAGACNADIRDDIAWMAARLAAAGLDRIFVVELAHPWAQASVVRVVVPGLEFTAIDQYRAGPRAMAMAAAARSESARESHS